MESQPNPKTRRPDWPTLRKIGIGIWMFLTLGLLLVNAVGTLRVSQSIDALATQVSYLGSVVSRIQIQTEPWP